MDFFNNFNSTAWKPNKQPVDIQIRTSKVSTQPTPRQNESLAFVRSHQDQIIKSIYNFHQKYIFTLYKATVEIDQDLVIKKLSETNQIYAIKSIEIPALTDEKSNYFIVNFHFYYDDEHDISFLFKNLNIIDFVGLGDDFIDYQELYEKSLAIDTSRLQIAIYESLTTSPIFRGHSSIHQEIDFSFETKAYRIEIYRKQEPAHFRLFFEPSDTPSRYSLNDIIGSEQF